MFAFRIFVFLRGAFLGFFFNEILGLATDFIAEFQYILWYFVSGVALEAIVRT